MTNLKSSTQINKPETKPSETPKPVQAKPQTAHTKGISIKNKTFFRTMGTIIAYSPIIWGYFSNRTENNFTGLTDLNRNSTSNLIQANPGYITNLRNELQGAYLNGIDPETMILPDTLVNRLNNLVQSGVLELNIVVGLIDLYKNLVLDIRYQTEYDDILDKYNQAQDVRELLQGLLTINNES